MKLTISTFQPFWSLVVCYMLNGYENYRWIFVFITSYTVLNTVIIDSCYVIKVRSAQVYGVNETICVYHMVH